MTIHETSTKETDKDDDNESTPPHKTKRRGQSERKAYSMLFKYRVLKFAQAYDSEFKKGGRRAAAERFNVNPSNVSKWFSSAEGIGKAVRISRGKRGRGYRGFVSFSAPRGPKPVYEAAEAVVIGRLHAARQKKKRVTNYMVRSWMKKTVLSINGAGVNFAASNTWLIRFRDRNNLVVRRRTNKKTLTATERLPKIQNFHTQLQKYVSTTTPTSANDEKKFCCCWTTLQRNPRRKSENFSRKTILILFIFHPEPPIFCSQLIITLHNKSKDKLPKFSKTN